MQVLDGVHLMVGDEVEFVFGMNPKTNERLGRRLKRTRAAPQPEPEVVPERNPNAMKFTGNLKVCHCL